MTTLLLLKSMLMANALQQSKMKRKVKLKKIRTNKKLDLNMCRICNEAKGDVSIFNNPQQPNIPDEITNFSGIIISKNDNLPKKMCQSCLNLLNGCIMFRDMSQQTNKVLFELSIKKEISCAENEDNNEHHGNSDNDSYNIPSPAFSDNSELWGCASCNTMFYDLKSYNTHLAKCHKQTINAKSSGDQNFKKKKVFLCDICGKTTPSNAGLLVHMSIHENIFPFKCDQCPYQGRTMDLLKVHKRSHLADKPFKCSHCQKTTTTSSNLAKHIRHVHSTTRPFKCTYCDKAFSYQHDMKRHVKDIHLRQGTVECDVCYKKFNTKKILQGHRWKIHKIKGERQGRLPSYLQYQVEENDNNMNNCDLNY